jgi:hypothetical protein
MEGTLLHVDVVDDLGNCRQTWLADLEGVEQHLECACVADVSEGALVPVEGDLTSLAR